MSADPLLPTTPLQGVGAPQTGGPSTSNAPRAKPAGEQVAGERTTPAFEALLERLQQQSNALSGSAPETPDELAPAVDEARSSLENALQLGDRLLEAYRASVQRGDAVDGGAA